MSAITHMTVFLAELKVNTPRRHGVGSIEGGIDNVFVKITDEDGRTGWGEASPWPVFTGTAEAAAGALDKHFRPFVVGSKASDHARILAKANKAVARSPEAKAALEMALLDLYGKQTELSVAELLGGRVRDEIPLSISIADPDFGRDRELAQRATSDGIGIFKIKTGFDSHSFDLMRLESLRAKFPDVDIRVDYNQGLDPTGAVSKLRDIASFKPTFIEQPVPADNWRAMTALTAAIDTPIMADESVFNAVDAFRAAEARIADLFSVKIMKSGGMKAGQEVSAVAKAAGIACYGGDMFESGLAHLAGTHMIAATENISLGCEFYQARYYLTEDILKEPFSCEGGMVQVPTKSGLGGDVDENRLRAMASVIQE
ncbi:MAG: muconate cycloisomerase [Proteobacteria bacterium]|nr:muconate cycloisomerase [Pseudomonadota bacterium]